MRCRAGISYGLTPKFLGLHVLSRDRDLPRTWVGGKYVLCRNLTHALPTILSQNEKLGDVSVGRLSRMSLVIDQREPGQYVVMPDEPCRPAWPDPIQAQWVVLESAVGVQVPARCARPPFRKIMRIELDEVFKDPRLPTLRFAEPHAAHAAMRVHGRHV